MFRYGTVTAVSQILIFGGLFVFVEFLGISPSLSYFIILTINYVGVYIAYTKFVFDVEFSGERMKRFVVLLGIIWVLNNSFFNLLLKVFEVQYLIAALLNIIILGLVRFFLQKTFVFNDESDVKNKIALTFDLEIWHESEWIQKNLDDLNPRDYLEESVEPILRLLKDKGGKATFFVTNQVLEKYPDLIKQISSLGHEIGSHCFEHRRLEKIVPKEFEEKMRQQVDLLEKITGKKPRGFRAPHFSLDDKNKWALPILAELGFKYDSSIFPVKTREYGVAKAPLAPYKISSGLWEIPPAVYRFGPVKIPVAGGIYFRIMPLWFFKKILNLVSLERNPVLYFHPYELYSRTPQIKKGPFLKRKLKYFGIKNSFEKLEKLLDSFQFDTMENILKL